MGVPKFFRYISERYPCLSEVVKEYQIPEFDNLYLDMNGIIHTCSHPDDGDPHFRITEEKIFSDIFHYIEVLFRMIKPHKLFFMAVDGVAPRAKMNQQRGRRFRSAKEAQTLENRARDRGEVLPTEERFDSNCITPGTVFMTKLQEQLKYFVINKISTDKLWQQCRIIFSGHETPGEGEHKIMDYIRYMRAQPGYDPNTRHCLYGLDADLIMLGLCTHEPHFSLLREEVKFGKKANKRKNVPEQITFFLLHLSLMREYLELEFMPLKDSLKFKYDMEKIIDDWVLMGFLVGNDFIPNLPNMHISNGALPVLYKAYVEVLPKLDGYINEGGILNLTRFEAFIKELGNIDIENFSERYADIKWFQSKTGRKLDSSEKQSSPLKKLQVWECENVDVTDAPLENSKMNPDLASLIKATNDLLLSDDLENADEKLDLEDDDESETSEDDLFNAEFIQHKNDYYINKLEYASVTPEVLKSQTEHYVRAIQWNLHYYYNGVCSWSWYYPHHYAPYVSDVTNFSEMKFDFELGHPFKPYEQLLAVLPAASKKLLPVPFQELMTYENSPIKDYYPEDFKTDLNGKKQEWEAVVLIPFIEENLLLGTMKSVEDRLTPEEKARNTHGPMLIYQYAPEDLGKYEAPEYFTPVQNSYALCKAMTVDEIRVPREKLVKGAYPGAHFDVYYPGFPTMKHLNYFGKLEKAKVKVFEQNSRGDNMILNIINERKEVGLDFVAQELLGEIVHVGWPHLTEALVISVSNKDYRYHLAGGKGMYNVEDNKGNLLSIWHSEKNLITEHYKNRLGIEAGLTETLVHVKTMTGRKYIFSPHGYITLEKQWANSKNAYPIQTIVQDLKVYEETYTSYKDINSVFPINSICFMLGQPHYGSIGTVLDSKESLKTGRVKLSIKVPEEPDFNNVFKFDQEVRTQYIPLHVAAPKLGISKNLFSRLTGSVFVLPGLPKPNCDDLPRNNIGLNLKFNKRNEEIPGYTRKEGNTWFYSQKAISLVQAYVEKFPQVISYLHVACSSLHGNNDYYFEEDMFPKSNAKESVKEIVTWIKKQPYYSLERQVSGSLVVDPEAVVLLEGVIDTFVESKLPGKNLVMQVKPRLLFKPDLQMGNLLPDHTVNFKLYDRVVHIRQGYNVPLGLKGTLIAIHKQSISNDTETLYDILFDEPFTGGLALNCTKPRVYRVPAPAVINVSHGLRAVQQRVGKPGQLLTRNFGASQNQVNFSSDNQFRTSNPLLPERTIMPNYQIPFPQSNNFRSKPNYSNNVNVSSNYIPQYAFVPYKPNHFPMYPPMYPMSREQISPVVQRLQQKNFTRNDCEQVPSHLNSGFIEKKPHINAAPKKILNNSQRSSPNKSLRINHNLSVKETDGQLSSKVNFAQSSPIQQLDTNALKKMLKIDSNNSHPDPFTRNFHQEFAVYSTNILLKKFQARGFGCPSYQYSEFNGQFIARLKLPNGPVISSPYKKTKDDAAEEAARIALQYIDEPPVMSIPEPPKKWQIKANNGRNQQTLSPKQNYSRIKEKNWPVENLKGSKASEIFSKPTLLIKDTSFVPLQAVRQNRTRAMSIDSPGSKVSKASAPPVVKSAATTMVPPSTSSNVNIKPRRERKMRIAANFSGVKK